MRVGLASETFAVFTPPMRLVLPARLLTTSTRTKASMLTVTSVREPLTDNYIHYSRKKVSTLKTLANTYVKKVSIYYLFIGKFKKYLPAQAHLISYSVIHYIKKVGYIQSNNVNPNH